MIDLSGAWQVRLDPDDAGDAAAWHTQFFDEQTINLPGTTDLAGLGFALDKTTMEYPVPVPRIQWPAPEPTPKADRNGHLVRDHLFIGKAWYQKTINIPADWADRHVRLRLERVLWQSCLWVDDRFIGSCDSLVSPHLYDLGPLAPGEHRLTVCIDNTLIHNIGLAGHAYGAETQSRWNGIVGRIELIATSPVAVDAAQVYPAPDHRSVRITITARNALDRAWTGSLAASISQRNSTRTLGGSLRDITVPPGVSRHELLIDLSEPALPWDEFSPVLHVANVSLTEKDGPLDSIAQTFGFRHIQRDGRTIRINGRRAFLRGTLDCCVYPRTGHPPMTVDEWLHVFETIKSYGFNHVRFHTWCPPDAAFEAADVLGLYLAPETPFWVDDWTAGKPPFPKLLGADPDVTAYVRAEIARIAAAYGNHPSFAFFCIGNEFGMSSDWDLVESLLAEAKSADPRRLYNAATTRRLVRSDDYWATAWVTEGDSNHWTRGVGPARTDWDFGDVARRCDLPIIVHETGQRPVFPDYDRLLPKFTGPVRPYNLERLRRGLVDAGMADQVPDFVRASALFCLVQYKAEHEAFLRTGEYAGYQLLMLNDFTGQSEALVGILDPFWESKGIVTVEQMRQWNSPTVPLARFRSHTWTTDQSFEAAVEVANYGPDDLDGATCTWSLQTCDSTTIAEGSLGPADLPTGAVTPLGNIAADLSVVADASALTLRIAVGPFANQWPIWVYPADAPAAAPQDILITDRFDAAAAEALARGERILLLAHGVKNRNTHQTRFLSVYWSAGWWGDRFSSLGVLCDPDHPALAGFPNNGHSDWQWHELTEGATTFDLSALSPPVRPIIQAIPDFHYNTVLGHVFEFRIGPGRLLACGYDLTSDLENRRAARCLRDSLVRYAASGDFDPACEITAEQAADLFAPEPAPEPVGD